MSKAKHAVSSRRRSKKVLKSTKGYVGGRSKLLRTAKETSKRAGVFNYRDRKKRKSEFRSIWIARISSACKIEGISYSKFISGLNKAGIVLNRKIISEIAVGDYSGFKALVEKIKK